MTAVGRIAAAQLGIGILLTRRTRWALRLLGYPDDTLAARSVVRVLGARHLVQGIVVVRGDRKALWGGAAVDVLHALTCLAYAKRSSDGRRAGLRSAAVALSLALAETAAARQPKDTGTRETSNRGGNLPRPVSSPNNHPSIARVGSASAAAWPEPTDDGQHILVETPAMEKAVHLTGGVMDGATVTVRPDATNYDIINVDHGKQRYVATGETDTTGCAVFTLQTD